MGWKNIAKVGRDWADAKKTELLTTDNRTREQARGAAEDAERAANREARRGALDLSRPGPDRSRLRPASGVG